MWRVSNSNADHCGLIGWDGVPDVIRSDEGMILYYIMTNIITGIILNIIPVLF
jgi:hypothetical protein